MSECNESNGSSDPPASAKANFGGQAGILKSSCRYHAKTPLPWGSNVVAATGIVTVIRRRHATSRGMITKNQ